MKLSTTGSQTPQTIPSIDIWVEAVEELTMLYSVNQDLAPISPEFVSHRTSVRSWNRYPVILRGFKWIAEAQLVPHPTRKSGAGPSVTEPAADAGDEGAKFVLTPYGWRTVEQAGGLTQDLPLGKWVSWVNALG